MTGTAVFHRIELVRGEITEQRVDAIVNPANTRLLGGGGVDGAIHRAAGPALREECQTLGGCPTGEARITGGYNLPALWVLHTVGPVWRDGSEGEARLLGSCYRNVLTIAADRVYGIRTIAIPGISIGAFGYPIPDATAIALDETLAFLEHNRFPETVRFVLFSETTLDIYTRQLAARNNTS